MDLNKFYIFQTPFSSVSVSVAGQSIDFDICIKLLYGETKGVKLPITLYQKKGRRWTDVLDPISVSLHVVSERFIKLLELNKVRGWKTFPVKILDKKGNEILGYHGFSIIGKCGAPDYTKSEVYEKQIAPNGSINKYYKGLHLDFDKWDGSDFFIPEGTILIVVTQKVKDIIERNKLGNIYFQSLAENETVDYALPKI
jgi:hypothetical protein